MTTTVRPLSKSDGEQITRVCTQCDQFIQTSCECRFLYGGGRGYLETFGTRNCRPREFLLRFFESRLRRTSEPNPGDRAEDLAHTLVHRLVEDPRGPSLLSLDLIGLRRFLAARAEHLLIDERRKSEGRVRCGNCRHHRRSGGERRCDHPASDHHWSGLVVVASDDPRKFEPPCGKYEGGRAAATSLDQAYENAGIEPVSSSPNPMEALEGSESAGIAASAFAEVQRQDPVSWSIIRMFFFEKRALSDIASHLGVSSKTIQRKKESGLNRLKAEFEERGIEDLGGLL